MDRREHRRKHARRGARRAFIASGLATFTEAPGERIKAGDMVTIGEDGLARATRASLAIGIAEDVASGFISVRIAMPDDE
jgi:hypothetical protein